MFLKLDLYILSLLDGDRTYSDLIYTQRISHYFNTVTPFFKDSYIHLDIATFSVSNFFNSFTLFPVIQQEEAEGT